MLSSPAPAPQKGSSSPSKQMETENSSLPLRLSVAAGGLGLELSRPLGAGPLVVEKYVVELVGLRYPIDLSKGVKYFRHRRSFLKKAEIRIALPALAQYWEESLKEMWGAGVRVRLRPLASVERTTVDANAAPTLASNDDVTQVHSSTDTIAVSIHSQEAALAFDLVVSSGDSPRFIVDNPRVIGRNEPGLLLALRSIDAGLGAMSRDSEMTHQQGLKRQGRTLEVRGLAEFISLSLLPPLGCRLPQIAGQKVERIETTRGDLRLVIGLQEQAFVAGGRALRVSGLAEFVKEADELLAQDELRKAREKYLEALQMAPGHPEILLELAEIDLAEEDRAESALSFLQELDAERRNPHLLESQSRLSLALGRALSRTARETLAREAWQRVFDLETDAVLGSLQAFELARLAKDGVERRKQLQAAIARAPFLSRPRELRFKQALEDGDISTAQSDANHLEARCQGVEARADQCALLGKAFFDEGHEKIGLKWLRRALRLRPENVERMMELAQCLRITEEFLRAGELYQAALRQLHASLAQQPSPRQQELSSFDRIDRQLYLRAEAKYQIAVILAEGKVVQSQDIPQALGYFSSIESRAHTGPRARLWEAELFHQEAKYEERDSALMRLFEAIELGWVDVDEVRPRLERLVASIEKDVDPALLAFGMKFMMQSSGISEKLGS